MRPAADLRLRSFARLDRLGVVVGAIAGAAALLGPFAVFKANRIVDGDPRGLFDAAPPGAAVATLAVIVCAAAIAALRTPAGLRLGAAAAGLGAVALAIGLAPAHLTPPGNGYARVAFGWGFWVLLAAFALLLADALTRLRFGPLARVAALAVAIAALALPLASGWWDGLSLMKEYASRRATFWAEARTHAALAFGSVAAAILCGAPLGVLCHRTPTLKRSVLNVLNVVQTIPSIALFGMLIGPLGWIAANVPGASAVGVAGVGAAPAAVALFLYALLPVTANTVVGLESVPAAAQDAARGVGMTDRQRLAEVEIPLALPVILTGARIVLVQNIGLATVAALIGGGGFGVFVFQGVGQTAIDLVLLGAAPTVLLAFAAAIVLDAVIETVDARGRAP